MPEPRSVERGGDLVTLPLGQTIGSLTGGEFKKITVAWLKARGLNDVPVPFLREERVAEIQDTMLRMARLDLGDGVENIRVSFRMGDENGKIVSLLQANDKIPPLLVKTVLARSGITGEVFDLASTAEQEEIIAVIEDKKGEGKRMLPKKDLVKFGLADYQRVLDAYLATKGAKVGAVKLKEEDMEKIRENLRYVLPLDEKIPTVAYVKKSVSYTEGSRMRGLMEVKGAGKRLLLVMLSHLSDSVAGSDILIQDCSKGGFLEKGFFEKYDELAEEGERKPEAVIKEPLKKVVEPEKVTKGPYACTIRSFAKKGPGEGVFYFVEPPEWQPKTGPGMYDNMGGVEGAVFHLVNGKGKEIALKVTGLGIKEAPDLCSRERDIFLVKLRGRNYEVVEEVKKPSPLIEMAVLRVLSDCEPPRCPRLLDAGRIDFYGGKFEGLSNNSSLMGSERLADSVLSPYTRPYTITEWLGGGFIKLDDYLSGLERRGGVMTETEKMACELDLLRIFREFVVTERILNHNGFSLSRDLKTDNIKIGRDGQVRMLDFGLINIINLDKAVQWMGGISQERLQHINRAMLGEYFHGFIGGKGNMSEEEVRGKDVSYLFNYFFVLLAQTGDSFDLQYPYLSDNVKEMVGRANEKETGYKLKSMKRFEKPRLDKPTMELLKLWEDNGKITMDELMKWIDERTKMYGKQVS